MLPWYHPLCLSRDISSRRYVSAHLRPLPYHIVAKVERPLIRTRLLHGGRPSVPTCRLRHGQNIHTPQQRLSSASRSRKGSGGSCSLPISHLPSDLCWGRPRTVFDHRGSVSIVLLLLRIAASVPDVNSYFAYFTYLHVAILHIVSTPTAPAPEYLLV